MKPNTFILVALFLIFSPQAFASGAISVMPLTESDYLSPALSEASSQDLSHTPSQDLNPALSQALSPVQSQPQKQYSGNTLMEYFNSMGGVYIEYTLTGMSDDGNVVIKQSGNGEVQGSCYHINSSGLEIFGNGDASYIYSKKSEELVITNDESLPLLSASKIKINADGVIEARYDASDNLHYIVKMTKTEKLEETLPPSHFIFSDMDNPNLIITDIR